MIQGSKSGSFSATKAATAAEGAGPRAVVAQYRAAGLRDVTLRLYPEGRHEPLNDLDAAGVRDDVLTWAEGRVVGGE